MATNGQQYPTDASRDTNKPDSDLDVYNETTQPAAEVDELQRVNYGLGFYRDEEFWQQVESYERGLRAKAGVGSVIESRARKETREEVGESRWDAWGEEEAGKMKRRELVEEHSGVEPEFVPTSWRVAQARLEASRGRDARLLDNVFGRVVERISKGGEEIKQALSDLGGGR